MTISNLEIIYRKAKSEDLKAIIDLLRDDDLGNSRQKLFQDNITKYVDVFNKINCDENQYLMVLEFEDKIIGTCHLTFMQSLTFDVGSRMNIEAVRISKDFQGHGFGKYMINKAIEIAKKNDVKIVQLTTNKIRVKAKKFYEDLGFKASHEGMKLYL
jgi:N-acetylglutamate synthase-like GNAT family acetyltransferase